MRTAVGAAVAATTLLTSPLVTSPASAAGVLVLNCRVVYASYGTGETTGTASCDVNGIPRAVSMSFGVYMSPSTCPAQEVVTGGRMFGVVNASISWARLGATATVTTWDGFDGNGLAVMATSGGLVCGQTNIQATIVMTLAGF